MSVQADAMTVKVTNLPIKGRQRLSVTDDDHYDMSHPRRGRFIILNNTEFEPETEHGPRPGATVDRDQLRACFKGLGFTCASYTNKTAREMAKVIHTVAKEDHSDADCFCCAILSHGSGDGVVYGTDGPISLDRLYEPLKRCPSLLGKPKLFIIQACRGEELDAGVTVVQADAMVDPANSSRIPLEADFLYMYATPPGYRAWRSAKNGSYFIQYLCEVLTKHGASKDLLWMLTCVNRRLATEFSTRSRDPVMDGMRQVASFVSMLTKELVFGESP